MRISRDRYDKRYGVEDQEARCREYATARGWVIVAVFEDNDESATKAKHPPQYRKMIAFLETGAADMILVDVWDRFGAGRLVWKFAEFWQWREKHNIRFVTCQGDDTNIEGAETMLALRAVLAQDEWKKMKVRLAKNQRRRAEKGQFNGGRYPYHVEYPESVPWLQKAAAVILDGGSLYSICGEWNKAGRRTALGGKFTPSAIGDMLLSPSIIGKQERDGELFEQPWDAVLEIETYQAIKTILTDPERRTNETNQRKYMLSGLLRCGVDLPNGRCGTRLISTGGPKDGSGDRLYKGFICSKQRGGCGKIRIAMEPLDEFIKQAVFIALDTPKFHKAVAAQKAESTNLGAELSTRVNALRVSLTSLEDEKDDGLIDAASYRRRRARITEKLDAAEAELTAVRLAGKRGRLPTGGELREAWGGYDNDQRREIVSAVIKHIDVYPHPRGVMSSPPRRRGEPLEEHRARFDAHRMHVMDTRTDIRWLA